MEAGPEAVLEYWFAGVVEDATACQARSAFWFSADAGQDHVIARRFGAVHARAGAGHLDAWQKTARGALALIVVLDQFSRHIYRGTARAFVQDARALAIASAGIDRRLDDQLAEIEKAFFYMPFQHAEDAALQRRSVSLYNDLVRASCPEFRPITEHNLKFALDHADIVGRYGRFPHRNKLVKRRPTEAEREYLESGGNTFGQS